MKTFVGFLGKAAFALLRLLTGLMVMVAVCSLIFALCVRGYTLISGDTPSLDSFDPKQRAAAADAAGQRYGVKP